MDSFEDMIKKAEQAVRKTEDIIYDEFYNTGIECVAEAKANETVKTGALRRSITTGEVDFDNGEYKMTIGSSLNYAKWVEEGHKIKTGKYKKVVHYVPGNHVISDAVDLYQSKLKQRIHERIEKEV